MFQKSAFMSIFCCDTLPHMGGANNAEKPNQVAYYAYSSKLTAAKSFDV